MNISLVVCNVYISDFESGEVDWGGGASHMFLFCTGASNLSPSIFCQRNGISFCQFVQTFRSKATVFFLLQIESLCQRPKTWMTGWHCHLESFCEFGKFLRIWKVLCVTLETKLESFWTVWKVSRWSGMFPDGLEICQMVWKA